MTSLNSENVVTFGCDEQRPMWASYIRSDGGIVGLSWLKA